MTSIYVVILLFVANIHDNINIPVTLRNLPITLSPRKEKLNQSEFLFLTFIATIIICLYINLS